MNERLEAANKGGSSLLSADAGRGSYGPHRSLCLCSLNFNNFNLKLYVQKFQRTLALTGMLHPYSSQRIL